MEENTIPKHIKELLEELETAKKEKNQKLQRKIRRILRSHGYYISSGGFSEERKAEAEKRAKERREKRKANRSSRQSTQSTKSGGFKHFDTKDANWDDIKKQYRALSKKYHPDNGGNEETMKEVNQEYEELKKRFNQK
ncbi:MAG: hypothetical protein D6785_16370 [Planctomycetota bacterium]|nr:MAG: hypothetical protein D6785_16370 [Planctomycetota bacterium]